MDRWDSSTQPVISDVGLPQASEGQKVSKTVYMEVDVHPDHRQREVEIISEICSDASNPMQAAVFCAEPGGVDFEPFIENNQNNPWIRGLRKVLHNPDIPKGACLKPCLLYTSPSPRDS